MLTVRQGYVDAGCAARYVAVGENQTVGREHEAGTAALRFAPIRRAGPLRRALAHVDLHDRRTHAIGRVHDGVGVSIERFAVVCGDARACALRALRIVVYQVQVRRVAEWGVHADLLSSGEDRASCRGSQVGSACSPTRRTDTEL